MKRALITGATGQDGQYLAEYLEVLGYEVIGMTRRSTMPGYGVQRGIARWVYGDMRDRLSIELAIRKSDPDEIYNLAGQSFVPPSWTDSWETLDVNAGGLARILEMVEKYNKSIRIYQASSSEMFGNQEGAADESTPFKPVSPYGVSKLAAHNLAQVYRMKGLYVSCGILFNHESPRRGPEMVTRKITRAVGQWKLGNKVRLKLGNITSERDWGFAGNYVEAMHKMLQQVEPDDFVVGTGVSRSVKEFMDTAIREAGLHLEDVSDLIEHDSSQKRPNELHAMKANARKAKEVLGWEPKTDFADWVLMMVNTDTYLPQVKEDYEIASSR